MHPGCCSHPPVRRQQSWPRRPRRESRESHHQCGCVWPRPPCSPKTPAVPSCWRPVPLLLPFSSGPCLTTLMGPLSTMALLPTARTILCIPGICQPAPSSLQKHASQGSQSFPSPRIQPNPSSEEGAALPTSTHQEGGTCEHKDRNRLQVTEVHQVLELACADLIDSLLK